jgi:hypothetical protein
MGSCRRGAIVICERIEQIRLLSAFDLGGLHQLLDLAQLVVYELPETLHRARIVGQRWIGRDLFASRLDLADDGGDFVPKRLVGRENLFQQVRQLRVGRRCRTTRGRLSNGTNMVVL